MKKALFEHKSLFVILTFIHAKWTKFKQTFVETVNKVTKFVYLLVGNCHANWHTYSGHLTTWFYLTSKSRLAYLDTILFPLVFFWLDCLSSKKCLCLKFSTSTTTTDSKFKKYPSWLRTTPRTWRAQSPMKALKLKKRLWAETKPSYLR